MPAYCIDLNVARCAATGSMPRLEMLAGGGAIVSAYERLRALSITLPKLPPPVSVLIPFARSGRLIFVSGQIAKRDGKPWRGQLGGDVTTEQGKEAARGVAIDLMSLLHDATGDLNRIARIVKLLVLVNSASTFTDQHIIANGASQLFKDVFGERGEHARSAFGVAQLPLGACVEIELIAELVEGA
jgi:enamine deaminase RidA (YjgF/YER057c/UK114 family)